jgi:hypothetical protein
MPDADTKKAGEPALSAILATNAAFPQVLSPSNRQDHPRRGACEARTSFDGPDFSSIAGGACGCAWLCANWRRIAETPRVRSQ